MWYFFKKKSYKRGIKIRKDAYTFNQNKNNINNPLKKNKMTVPISKVTFVAKAEVFGPKYYEGELTALQNLGAVTMVQIPGFFTDDPKPASKITVGINSNGDIMSDPNDLVVFPCPNFCDPPGPGQLVTLSSFLNQ